MRKEIFKPHPEFSSYLVSNYGRVFSVKSFKYLKPTLDSGGYLGLVLNHGKSVNRKVHRLVLETFVGSRPRGFQCAHLNGNRKDNRLQNLKWVTPKENDMHKDLHGTRQRGEKNSASKLNAEIVREIRRTYRRTSYHGSNARQLAERFGIDRNTVQRIASGRGGYWSHVK